jgi:negative regulator of sigma E activity
MMTTRRTWIVFYGKTLQSCRVFHAEYHAEQYARAMQLNGTEFRIVNADEKIYD